MKTEPELKLNAYAEDISIWRISQGFHTPVSLESEPERDLMLGKLMLVVTEVSEMAEAVRHNDLTNFREELADSFIRLMDIGRTLRIDMEGDIAAKMAVNKQRPFKHGKLCSL